MVRLGKTKPPFERGAVLTPPPLLPLSLPLPAKCYRGGRFMADLLSFSSPWWHLPSTRGGGNDTSGPLLVAPHETQRAVGSTTQQTNKRPDARPFPLVPHEDDASLRSRRNAERPGLASRIPTQHRFSPRSRSPCVEKASHVHPPLRPWSIRPERIPS